MQILAVVIGFIGVICSVVIGSEVGFPIGISIAASVLIFSAILFGFGNVIDNTKNTEASNREILQELREIKEELKILKEQQPAEKKEEPKREEPKTAEKESVPEEKYTKTDKHTCTKCGKEQLKGSRYCIYCGERFED